jgi:hypothetical protein
MTQESTSSMGMAGAWQVALRKIVSGGRTLPSGDHDTAT